MYQVPWYVGIFTLFAPGGVVHVGKLFLCVLGVCVMLWCYDQAPVTDLVLLLCLSGMYCPFCCSRYGMICALLMLGIVQVISVAFHRAPGIGKLCTIRYAVVLDWHVVIRTTFLLILYSYE